MMDAISSGIAALNLLGTTLHNLASKFIRFFSYKLLPKMLLS